MFVYECLRMMLCRLYCALRQQASPAVQFNAGSWYSWCIQPLAGDKACAVQESLLECLKLQLYRQGHGWPSADLPRRSRDVVCTSNIMILMLGVIGPSTKTKAGTVHE